MTGAGPYGRFTARARGLAGLRCPIVAFSGGADSAALLVLSAALGLEPVAVHVDHGLRVESATDVVLARGIAERLGVTFEARHVAIADGSNLEARARDARYAALEAARVARRASAILVAHTADDQAETVLLNVLRGSAASGLAGMATHRGSVLRPLLSLRRSDTAEICMLAGIAPVQDPMNDDDRFRRVWLRREVLPLLERSADRDLVAVLGRQAAVMREESDLLDGLGAELLARAGEPVRASVLAAAPRALARRAVRAWLGSPPPDQRVTDEVLAVATGERRAAMLRGGRVVERAGDRLTIAQPTEREAAALQPEHASLSLPGRATALGLQVDAWVSTAPPVAWPDGREVCVVDAERAGPDALVRAVLADDRLHPLGLGGSKRAVRALAERGVPRAARRLHPLVVAGRHAAVPAGEPLWLVGYGVDDRVRVTRSTRRYLWLSARVEGPASSSPDSHS